MMVFALTVAPAVYGFAPPLPMPGTGVGSETALFGLSIIMPQETEEEQRDSKQQQQQQQDDDDDAIVEGSVVRVVAEGLKAFHVSKKMWGSYNDEGEFVPVQDPQERTDKCLILPVGLCGVVQFVYDVEEVSSNLPIKAIFEPTDEPEEGKLNPPGRFIMHFDTHEVERVE